MPVKHKLLRGKGSGKYLGFATQKVARLVEEARGREPSRTKRYTVDNGMVDVKVSIQDEQHYVKITRRTCPAQLNGLCDFVFHNVSEVPGSPALTPIYQIPDPANPDATINIFRRFYPSPETKPADRAWRDERGLAKSEEAAQQLRFLPASMFTGEMRKVVQILQGRGEKVPYSPTFALSHGVFTASTGQRWVIEVSNQGVYAWVMGMCRNPVKDAQGTEVLSYTPISMPRPSGDAFTAALAAGTFRVLAGQSDMMPFYQKWRFFPTCGWAFNTNGHSALNVCWDWPGVYKRSYLYGISIVETQGAPSGASLSLDASGLIYGPRTTSMKYPETGFTNLFSFDTSYGNPGDTNADGPVYAYYSDDVPVVVTYANFPASSPVTYNDPIPTILNGNLICESLFGRSLNVGTISTVNIVHFTSTEGLGAKEFAENRGSGTYDHIVTKLEDVGLARQDIGFNVDLQAFRAQTSRRGQSADSYSGRSVIIIPWGDRESFIFAEEVTYNFPATTYTQESGYVTLVTGRFLTQPVRYCAGAPATPISEKASGVYGEPLTYCADGTPQWVLRLAPFVSPVWPVTTGVEYQFKVDSGVCGTFITAPLTLNAGIVTSNQADPRTEKTYKYRLYSSGARPYTLPDLPDGFRWNDLLAYTEDGSQNMGVFRDACDPEKFIMSPDINKFGGANWLSNAGQYPVPETGSVVRFVGVP